MSAIPQSKPTGGLAWLLIIEADTVYRFASEDIFIDGTTVYWGLESDEIRERVGAGNTDSSISGFPIPDTADIPRFIKGLQAGSAELSLIPFDADHIALLKDRIVLKKGRIEDIELNPFLTSVTVNLIGNEADDYGDLCPPSLIVEERTWPFAAEDARGKRYPRVYGAPGSFEYQTQTNADAWGTIDYTAPWDISINWITTGVTKTAGATPALPVEAEIVTITTYIGADETTGDATYIDIDYPGYPRYLLACIGTTEATSIEVWSKSDQGDGWLVQERPLVQLNDGHSRIITAVDLLEGETDPAALRATHPYRKGGEFWLAWKNGGATTSSLGDLIKQYLALSTVQIDQSALESAVRYLQRYKIGGYVDDSITPTAWVDDRLKSFGVVSRWSQEGYSLQVVDPAWQSFASASLTIDEGAEVAGTVKIIPPELDEVIVSWTGPGASQTAHRRISSRVTRVGAPLIIGGDRRDELKLPECWDSSTAIAAGELALRLAAGYTEITLRLDTLSYWWLRAGDSVYLTWDMLEFSESDGLWQVYETEHTAETTRSVTLRKYNQISTVAQATIESSTLDE